MIMWANIVTIAAPASMLEVSLNRVDDAKNPSPSASLQVYSSFRAAPCLLLLAAASYLTYGLPQVYPTKGKRG